MTRIERNEYNYIRKSMKNGLSSAAQVTIRTDAGSEYKHALDNLYTSQGFHPAAIETDPRRFDEKERIIYIRSNENAGFDWAEVYSEAEKEHFAARLN